MAGRHRAPRRRRPRGRLVVFAAGVLLGVAATCAVWSHLDPLVYCASGPVLKLPIN